MKGRITTVLSLAGVLVAGSAAAMVNTQVLQSTESQSSAQVAAESPDNTVTDNTVTDDSVTDDSVTDNTVTDDSVTDNTVTKIQSSVLTSSQALYQVGDAGLVTLDTAGDVLTIVSVTPNAGWTVVKAESDGQFDIEVKLQNGNTLVEFEANLQLGVITTSVEAKILGSDDAGSTPGTGTTPGSGTIDDDDSDDDDSDDHNDDDDSDDEEDEQDDEDSDDHEDEDDSDDDD